MPSFETIKVLIMLLPGFLSQRIVAYFGTQYNIGNIDSIISALSFTVVNFYISTLIGKIIGIQIAVNNTFINPDFIIVIFLVSILTGVVWAMIDRKDLLYKIRLTSKLSRSHMWTKLFKENEEWHALVKVGLNDGRIFFGWPHYRSEQQEQNNMLFLKPAYEIDSEKNCKKLMGFGILLFERDMKDIEFIKVPKGTEDPCQLLGSPDPENFSP